MGSCRSRAAGRVRPRPGAGRYGLLGLVCLGVAFAAVPRLVVVDRGRRRVHLFLHGRRAASYRASVGEPAYPTPVGVFRVSELVRDPSWVVPNSEWAGPLAGTVVPHGAPGNLLRARWIRFCGPYGLHGTDFEVGDASSHGCVRLGVPDVEDLFDRVRIGTPVIVFP